MSNMLKMSQKEAVFNAVVNVCGSQEVYKPTKEQRAQVALILFEGFKSGTIELEKNFDDKKLKEYIPGLVSNWIRKDKRLNGGVTYVAKNPGSRSSDPTIKSLRALLSTLTEGTPDHTEISEALAIAQASRAEAMKPKVEINFDALPEHIRVKYQK